MMRAVPAQGPGTARSEPAGAVQGTARSRARANRNQMEESMRVEEEGSSSLVEKYKRYKYTELEKEMERWKKTSIYRVPEHIKNMKYSSAYRPQLVSLGPFHYGDPNLWPMEGHKHRALLHLVKRADKPMDEFVAAVKKEADQLEAAYGQDLDQEWRGDNGRERFVDMMVTDGCFLLEAMMMIELKGKVSGYEPNDPVFSEHGYLYLKNVILADMFVMENQLPMLLLNMLAIHVPSGRFQDVGGMIKNMVVAFYGLPFDNSLHLDEDSQLQLSLHLDEDSLHLDVDSLHLDEDSLHLDVDSLHLDELFDPPVHSLHPIDIARKILCGESERGRNLEIEDTMPSALELYEAGVHFKAIRSRSLLDIDFQRGVLSMPMLRVHSYVRTVFLNLMAFEQLHPGAGNGVTEYLIFMDHIIDSAKDVALLRSTGVLDCALGCDKEVAELFNTLTKGAVMDPSMKLQGVRLRVNAYCRKTWPKWRASFVETYLRNAWVFFSLVAAVVLLVATLLQTIFTIIKP